MVFVFMKKIQSSRFFGKSILFFIPLLITSCVGGTITINATDGSKIKFKSENVSCEKNEIPLRDGSFLRNTTCNANGVRTFLNGDKVNFSERYKVCRFVNDQGFEEDSRTSITCLAAKKLKKYK